MKQAITKAGISIVLFVFVSTLTAYAAGQREAAVATEELRIIYNWGDEVNPKGFPARSLFDDLMAMYPSIRVQTEHFSDKDIPTRVVTMFMAGNEPHLAFQNLHMAALDWLDDGVTVDVTDLAKEWGVYDNLKPEAVAEWTDGQGRLRAFPFEGYSWPVWYNVGILEASGVNGIPTTTDELINAAQKVREAGYQPFTAGGTEWTGEYVFFGFLTTMLTDDEIRALYSNGGFSANRNAVAAVENFVRLRDAGVFADDMEGMTNAFANEQFFGEEAAIMHGGSWHYALIPEAAKQNVVLGGFPLPSGSQRANPTVYFSFEAKGVWITRNGASERLDAIEKLIKLFYQPESMRRFVEEAAMTSPLKETPVDASKLNSLFVQANTDPFASNTEVALLHKIYVPLPVDATLRRAAREALVPGVDAATILKNLDAAFQY